MRKLNIIEFYALNEYLTFLKLLLKVHRSIEDANDVGTPDEDSPEEGDPSEVNQAQDETGGHEVGRFYGLHVDGMSFWGELKECEIKYVRSKAEYYEMKDLLNSPK